MTLEEYQDHLAEMIKEANIPESTIFNPEFSPNATDYLDTFGFYIETLNLNRDYGIEPAYLFFKNEYSLNAAATKTETNNYIVAINMGTIDWLLNKFKNNPQIVNDTNINLFRIFQPYLDNPINVLMYQTCCHFTFYHEMAHLIQNSNYLKSTLYENPESTGCFNFERHLLEIDADTFSALCLGTHIIQYCEKQFGQNFSKQNLEGLIVLFTVPIFLYFLSFSGNKNQLYLKETTHPHPNIRVTNFILVLTHYCNGVLNSKNRGFTADQGNLIIFSLEIAEKLQEFFFQDDVVTRYRKTMAENKVAIIEYLGELVETNHKLEETATNKWNLRHA